MVCRALNRATELGLVSTTVSSFTVLFNKPTALALHGSIASKHPPPLDLSLALGRFPYRLSPYTHTHTSFCFGFLLLNAEHALTAVERYLQTFAYGGLTDYYNLSVCLFHRMFGGKAHPDEFTNMRPGADFFGARFCFSSVRACVRVRMRVRVRVRVKASLRLSLPPFPPSAPAPSLLSLSGCICSSTSALALAFNLLRAAEYEKEGYNILPQDTWQKASVKLDPFDWLLYAVVLDSFHTNVVRYGLAVPASLQEERDAVIAYCSAWVDIAKTDADKASKRAAANNCLAYKESTQLD